MCKSNLGHILLNSLLLICSVCIDRLSWHSLTKHHMNSELIEHQLHKMLGPINFNTLHAPWHALIILILFAHNTSIDNIK